MGPSAPPCPWREGVETRPQAQGSWARGLWGAPLAGKGAEPWMARLSSCDSYSNQPRSSPSLSATDSPGSRIPIGMWSGYPPPSRSRTRTAARLPAPEKPGHGSALTVPRGAGSGASTDGQKLDQDQGRHESGASRGGEHPQDPRSNRPILQRGDGSDVDSLKLSQEHSGTLKDPSNLSDREHNRHYFPRGVPRGGAQGCSM